MEQFEEERERCGRDLRTALEELSIAQDHAKACDAERMDIKKKCQVIEENYKRDTELFRTEVMKRDQDIDEEKSRLE